MRPLGLAAGLALAVQTVSLSPVGAQEPRRTVWSGVYSEAQAARGATGFTTNCESCHNRDLSGNEGPALVGPRFQQNWTGLTLRELFHHIRVAMPEDAVSSVSNAEKLDILTFILQRNGFPAGTRDLTMDAADLAAIAFEGRNGPEPPPVGATVRSFGCLTNAGSGWSLQRATEPLRTTIEVERDPATPPPAVTSGTATVPLVGVSPGSDDRDQLVKILGFMIRTPEGARINVLEMSRLGRSCEP